MTKEDHSALTSPRFNKAISGSTKHKHDLHSITDPIIDNDHNSECGGTHFQPLKNDWQHLFEPTLSCFCKKPAYRYYTMEYGPILECAKYDENSPNYNPLYVCGFHVHELSWNKLYQQLAKGYSVYSRYSELRACPIYNFTYCSIFKVKNDYKNTALVLPNCFCGNAVKMVQEERSEDPYSPVITHFMCANRYDPGVRKCNWLNTADNVPFPKTKHRLHRAVDYEAYNEQRNTMINNLRCGALDASNEKSFI